MGQKAASIDRDNPWPGLVSYDEAAQAFFSGRNAEIAELVRRIVDEPVTVLFGKSGLGKSSLLKAGVFPLLRRRGLLPVPVRLHFGADAAEPTEQLAAALFAAFDAESISYPARDAGEVLWDYLHRAKLRFWTATVHPVQPVLVLDQFEEVFTLGRGDAAPALRERLADLAENRIPAALAARVERGEPLPAALDVNTRAYKIVVSLREDYLPDLEGWVPAMPSLRRNRMRLLPLARREALQAVCNEQTGHLVDEALGRRIVAYLASRAGADPATTMGGDDDAPVEPALLSLVCRGINEARKREGKARFDDALFEAGKGRIVADFYRECLADQPPRVARFIEDKLVSEHGFRNNYVVADAVKPGGLMRPEEIATLVDRRLLRLEHVGTERVELTHDLLTKAVLEGRAKRIAQEARDQRRRQAWQGVGVAGVVLAVALGFGWMQYTQRLAAQVAAERAKTAARQAQSRELAARARELRSRDQDDDQAIRVASEALLLDDTPEARTELLRGLRRAWPTARLGIAELGGKPKFAAIDAGGERIAVISAATGTRLLGVWDLASGQPARLWPLMPMAEDSADAVAFTLDGSRLAVGSPGRIDLLSAADGRVEQSITLPPVQARMQVEEVIFSGDGGTIAARLGDGAVLVRRLDKGSPWERAYMSDAGAAAVSHDGNRVTVAVAGPPLRAYVSERGPGGSWRVRPMAVTGCVVPQSVSPAPDYVVATWKAQACTESLATGAEPRRGGEGEAVIADTITSPSGAAFVAKLVDGTLRVARGDPASASRANVGVEVRSGRVGGYGNLLGTLAVDDAASRLVIRDDSEVRIIGLADEKPLLTRFDRTSVATSADLRVLLRVHQRRDGAWLQASPFDPTDKAAGAPPRWRVLLPAKPRSLESRGERVFVGFEPRDGDGGPRMAVYDLGSGRLLTGPDATGPSKAASVPDSLQGSRGQAWSSPSGRYRLHSQADADAPSTTLLRDGRPGYQFGRRRIDEAHFSADERWLAVLDTEGRMTLLNLRAMLPVQVLLPQDATSVAEVEMLGGGELLLVRFSSDQVVYAPLDAELLARFAIRLVSRRLSPAERCTFGLDEDRCQAKTAAAPAESASRPGQ